MKYFNTVQQVIISEAVVERAKNFATQVTATTNYADSNQFSNTKISNDHFISKIGEEAVKQVLSDYANVVGPDYNVYHGKRKSWDDDLYVNNVGVAVKTQKRTTAQRFGLSWSFQAGPSRCDVILKKPDAWVVFAAFDDIKGNVCYVYPPFQNERTNPGRTGARLTKRF